jgi:uncharacterized protein (DUF2147 family)
MAWKTSAKRNPSGIAQIRFVAMQTCFFLGMSMTCRSFFVAFLLTAMFAATSVHAQADGGVQGVWLTQAGDAKVRVTKCGGGICGVIVWLKEPIDAATGKPAVDDKNPNAMLAKRPMIGLPLFSGMRPDGQNRWSGQIYNADDGKSYVSHISAGGDALRVEGCVGTLCGGETWSRAGR